MATQVAELPLKAGISLDDANSAGGSVWRDFLATLHSQDGMQRTYWGTRIEDPTTLTLLVDWESIGHHEKFMKSPSYGPSTSKLATLLSSKAKLWHVKLSPHPATQVLSNTSSPVTEPYTVTFPSSISPSDQSAFSENVAEFSKALDCSEGCTGHNGGWAEETTDDTRFYFGFIGWTSVDAHMRFRETSAFRENVGLLRGKDLGATGISAYHVSLLQTDETGVEERGAAPAQDVQEEVLNPTGGPRIPPKTSSK